MVSVSELQCFLYLTLLTLLLTTPLAVSSPMKMSLPGCPDKCGNITIPYPFGTRPGCYRPGFQITCNDSTSLPKAFLGSSNIELIDINVTSGEARIYNLIGYACYDQTSRVNASNPRIDISHTTTFFFSNRRNKFTVMGCYNMAYIVGRGKGSYQSGCAPLCASLNSTIGDGGSCNGFGCCQTTINAGLNYHEVQWGPNENKASLFNRCSYSVLVEEDWYKFQVRNLCWYEFLKRDQLKRVPVVLDLAIRENGTCLESHMESSINPACQSKKSGCDNTTNGDGYLCKCLRGYKGNPYILDGCIDIDECKFPEIYPCEGTCTNTEGDYKCSLQRKAIYPYFLSMIFENLGIGIGFAVMAVLLRKLLLVRLSKKTRSNKIKKKFFEKNHGLLLQQLISSNRNIAERMMIFSLAELEKATNNFEQNRIVGRGGHGIVYKGILSDQRVVAVKRSSAIKQREIDQFINEVVILSQIDHRNVVKLYGCCLESEVPLLVFEFISNGTLFNHLHVSGSLLWKNRFIIALETARALSHLHSAASISVFHRDIKSANILLDDYLTAKVSDFGASRSIRMDQSRVTTVIQGTLGYLDPEYYYTGILTQKSDVFSFGVILAELLTREKPTSASRFEGGENLVSFFCMAVRENRLNDILDPLIMEEVNISQIEAVAALAEMSLRLKGEERPTMKEVEMRLEFLHGSRKQLCQSWGTVADETQSLINNQSRGCETTRQYSLENDLIASSHFGR